MRTFINFMSGLFLMCAISLLHAQSWQNVDVSATKKQEADPDVAVEANGTAHIVFRKETIKIQGSPRYDIFYANTVGNSLSTPQQLTNLGADLAEPVVILDSSGKLHVAFFNRTSDTVAYLNNTGGSFSIITEFGVDPLTFDLDMDIDNSGKAHIVYHKAPATGGTIFYATNITGAFVLSDLGSFGLELVSEPVCDEAAGVVHVAFLGRVIADIPGSSNIYYVNNDNPGGVFDTSPTLAVDTGGNDQDPTISVDNTGTVHIVNEVGTNNGPFHSENSSGAFLTEPDLGPGPYGAAHALGPQNEVGILGTASDPNSTSFNNLIFTTNKSGSWTSEEITSPGSGDEAFNRQHGIAIDGSGYIHVVGRIDRGSSNKPNLDVRYHTNNPDFGQPPNAGTDCFVQDIAMSLTFKGNGKPSNRGWTATATVLIHDDLGNPVSNATVSGDWSGLTSDSDTGTTGSDGKVSLDSDRINVTGTFTFTVTGVSHSSLTYTPALNVMTSNSISNASKRAPEETLTATSIPSEFQLFQNHPNPFNPETSINFALPKASHVEVTIYNTRGQIIRRLVNTGYGAGEYSVTWDGRDQSGNSVSSGVYLYELQAGAFRQVKKMSLLR